MPNQWETQPTTKDEVYTTRMLTAQNVALVDHANGFLLLLLSPSAPNYGTTCVGVAKGDWNIG